MKDVSDNKTLDWVGRMKSSAEIRHALIQIAERKGYPYYSLSVVRDVIFVVVLLMWLIWECVG